MKIGESLYKAQQAGGDSGSGGDAAGGDGAAAGAGKADDKVVDADFEEIDDRKGKTAG